MSDNVDSNTLKEIATRNIRSTLIAYAVPVILYSGLVAYFGFTSTPYWVFVGIYLICVLFIFGSMLAIQHIQHFNQSSGGPLLFSQLVFWLIMSHLWLFLLEEGRTGGLAFALSMLVYTFAYGTLKVAVVLNTLIVIGFLAVSYVAIHYYEQPGSMAYALMAIVAYLPVSIFVGKVGSKLARKKRYMKALMLKQNETQQLLQDTLLKLEQAASTDELTGLVNRREINRILAYEFEKIQRNHTQATVVIFDLDHFKKVNDTYGHSCGDHVLKAAAQIMKNQLRQADCVARWGGEEFMVLMPETSPQEALVAVQRVIDKIAKTPVQYEQYELNITVSAGLSALLSGSKITNVLNEADEQLYVAKSSGRNQVAWAMGTLDAANQA